MPILTAVPPVPVMVPLLTIVPLPLLPLKSTPPEAVEIRIPVAPTILPELEMAPENVETP